MSKKQYVLSKLAELSGSKHAWVSRAELITALGWATSVSPLLNRLVAEGKVEQVPWIGEGFNGRLCSGFRPIGTKRDKTPAVLIALQGLDDIKARLEVIAQTLRSASVGDGQ